MMLTLNCKTKGFAGWLTPCDLSSHSRTCDVATLLLKNNFLFPSYHTSRVCSNMDACLSLCLGLILFTSPIVGEKHLFTLFIGLFCFCVDLRHS